MTKPKNTSGNAPERGKDEDMNIPIEDGDAAKNEKIGASAGETTADVAEPTEVEAEVIEPGAEDGQVEEAVDGDVVEEANEVLADAAMKAAAEELKKAQAEAADWQDKYVRLHAEWDTYRRRMKEQQKEDRARATEKLVSNLLPVLDDFERTVAYADQNGEGGLLDGVKAVQSKLIDALVKDGLEVIDPAGEEYNALEAQAVATVDDASVPDETVAQVYQKGYKMGNKVLRAAMVTVTTGGPKREKPAPEEGEEAESESAEATDAE